MCSPEYIEQKRACFGSDPLPATCRCIEALLQDVEDTPATFDCSPQPSAEPQTFASEAPASKVQRADLDVRGLGLRAFGFVSDDSDSECGAGAHETDRQLAGAWLGSWMHPPGAHDPAGTPSMLLRPGWGLDILPPLHSSTPQDARTCQESKRSFDQREDSAYHAEGGVSGNTHCFGSSHAARIPAAIHTRRSLAASSRPPAAAERHLRLSSAGCSVQSAAVVLPPPPPVASRCTARAAPYGAIIAAVRECALGDSQQQKVAGKRVERRFERMRCASAGGSHVWVLPTGQPRGRDLAYPVPKASEIGSLLLRASGQCSAGQHGTAAGDPMCAARLGERRASCGSEQSAGRPVASRTHSLDIPSQLATSAQKAGARARTAGQSGHAVPAPQFVQPSPDATAAADRAVQIAPHARATGSCAGLLQACAQLTTMQVPMHADRSTLVDTAACDDSSAAWLWHAPSGHTLPGPQTCAWPAADKLQGGGAQLDFGVGCAGVSSGSIWAAPGSCDQRRTAG